MNYEVETPYGIVQLVAAPLVECGLPLTEAAVTIVGTSIFLHATAPITVLEKVEEIGRRVADELPQVDLEEGATLQDRVVALFKRIDREVFAKGGESS